MSFPAFARWTSFPLMLSAGAKSVRRYFQVSYFSREEWIDRPILHTKRAVTATVVSGTLLGAVVGIGIHGMNQTNTWVKVFSNGAYVGMVPNQPQVTDSLKSTAIGYNVNVSMTNLHTSVEPTYKWRRVASLPTTAIAIEVGTHPVAYTSNRANALQVLNDVRVALVPSNLLSNAKSTFVQSVSLAAATVGIADISTPMVAVQHILHPHTTALSGRSSGLEAIVGLRTLPSGGSRRAVLQVQSSTKLVRTASQRVPVQVAVGDAVGSSSLITVRTEQTVPKVVTVQPPVHIVRDANLPVGQTKVITAGRPERLKEQVNEVYFNGSLQKQVVLSREVLQKPVAQIEDEGTNNGMATGSWLWPSPYTDITSGFGWRVLFGAQNFHPGVDIGCPVGSPVYASNDGVVEDAGWNNGGYGNWVLMDNGNGIQSVYGHMSQVVVQSGQTVTKGQVIGYSGETGFVTGPHLHYEIRVNGTAVNPAPYM